MDTTLPLSKIDSLRAQGHTLNPVKSLAYAYAKAMELFKKDDIYYTGLASQIEISEGGKVVFSVYPRENNQLKKYFII